MENNNRRKLGTYQICLIALAIVMNVIGGQIALKLSTAAKTRKTCVSKTTHKTNDHADRCEIQ